MHNLQLTDDQTLILDTVTKYVADAVAPHAQERDEHRTFARDEFAGLAELGLFAMPMVTAPSARDWRSAATVNGVVPLAARPITTSAGLIPIRSIWRMASTASSSAPSALATSAPMPPATVS